MSHSWEKLAIALYDTTNPADIRSLGSFHVGEKLGVDLVTDYEVANEMPSWNGVFVAKSLHGVAAIRFVK